MADYQYGLGGSVIHKPSGANLNPGKTRSWRKYQAWLEAGGVPDPAPTVEPGVDQLIEMRDLLLQARNDFDGATSLAEAKVALLDFIDALLGRHPGQRTTMCVRDK